MYANLLQWDYAAFYCINQVWISSLADKIFPLLREPFFWTPLYVFIGLLVWCNSENKKTFVFWCMAWICVVALCDSISSSVIKVLIYRPRPCLDPFWEGKVRQLVAYCSTRSSFTSSHASNHFGMGVFFWLTLKAYLPKVRWLFLLWAGAVSYAQIYVGLHYLLDIIGGALLGSVIGWGIARGFLRNFS